MHAAQHSPPSYLVLQIPMADILINLYYKLQIIKSTEVLHINILKVKSPITQLIQILTASQYMESAKDITNFEIEEFNKIRETYPIDQNIEALWKNYYSQYRSHLPSILTEKVHLHLKCAYFLAQKSTWITTINGQKVRNVSISLSQLLKKNALQQVMFTLKDYSNKVKFQDQSTLEDLQKTIKQISFMITFYSKYQKIITKLQMKEKDKSESSYTQTLIELIWLMYIECKAQILKRSLELIDNTCMLAHAMSFMLIYSWDYYQAPYFLTQKNLTKSSSRKQVNYCIKEKILQLFLIKNIDNYKQIAGQFQKYFINLQQKHVIKMSNGRNNFLSPQFINLNYKRLDHFYQKKLDISHLDERLFFKDGVIANITPFKFTPFNRQKIHIPLNKVKLGNNFEPQQNKNNHTISYNSHRVLTYDNIQNQESHNQNIPLDIKLPKTVIPSPCAMKNTLLQQTPYTNGLLMYNYMNDLVNKIKKNKYQPRRSDKLVFQLIGKVLKEKCKDLDFKKYQKLIFSVFKPIYQEFIAINSGEQQNQSILTSFILFSIEIVFFASNIQISFNDIQSCLQQFINPLDEWKACDFFQKFDKNMNINIKVHFLDLQVDLISSKIWKQSTIVTSLSDFYNNLKNSSDSAAIYNKLGRRILHQIAFQITQVCKECILCLSCQKTQPAKHCQQCKKIQQSIAQQSFEVMKQTLLHKIQILQNQYLDQIILCIIFSVCKIQQWPIKFNALVGAYKKCNQHNSDKHAKIIHSIQICQGQQADIIGYFNKKFVPLMQQFIRSKTISTSRPQTYPYIYFRRRVMKNTTNTLMQSPLTAIIPKEIANKSYNQCFKGNNMGGKNNATPRLYAYNQSPLLKNQFTSFKTPVNSKRTLFQPNDQAQKFDKQIKVEQASNIYQQNVQTNTYLKKFTSKSPCLIKSPVIQKGSMMNRSPINILSNNSNQTVIKQFHSQSYHSGISGIGQKKNILNR